MISWTKASYKDQKLKSARKTNLKTIKKIKDLITKTKDGAIPSSHLRIIFKKIKELSDKM